MTTISLRAQKILQDFRSGSSQPALVEASDGNKYVVKWKCTGDGPASPATDWIALRLAHAAGIPVPQSFCITVEAPLAETTRHGELKDLIRRSVGVNLAVEYLPDARPFAPNDLHLLDESLRTRIFLFDLLLLNIDRSDSNTNMLVSNDKIYLIDFTTSMEIKFLLTNTHVSEEALLQRIRRHSLYAESVAIPSFEISDTQIADIIESVPEEWFNDIGGNASTIRKRTTDGLHKLFADSRPILEKRLKLLASIIPESREEISARGLRNRRAFEAKLGKPL